jgi:opacity protein-like surface antigen
MDQYMRYFATVILTAALVAWSAPTAAQTFGFGAHAGVSIPTGDYSDAADLGFSGGLDLTYPLLMVSPALSWYTSADAVAHSASAEAADGGFLYFPIMTGLRVDAGAIGMIRPFATGQLGLVLARGPDLGPSPQTGTEFGFALGGGLQLTDNVYAGLKWFNMGTVDFSYEPDLEASQSVSFLDIYVGFGVR